jgi:hypothetical protein
VSEPLRADPPVRMKKACTSATPVDDDVFVGTGAALFRLAG